MKARTWTLLCVGLIIISLTYVHPVPRNMNLCQTSSMQFPHQPIKHTPAQEIGDTRLFWAWNFDTSECYLVNGCLLAIGNRCYIFFDDLAISIIGEEEAAERAEIYREEFDNNIYPRVTDLAGDPDGTLGDVDGDPKIYILIVEHRQSYYRQTNEAAGEYSNMCEMVYICYRTTNPVSTIAHEFHHLVWFNHEFDEVHFVLEGVAEYATYYSGYLPANNWTTRVQYFLDDIDDAFVYFEVEAQDYGACYLFAFYLAEQYGVQFLRDLVQHEDDGARGLETALDEAGHHISFNELYMDWMTALTIDQPGFAEDRYCYRDMDATIQDCTTIETLPYQDENVPLYCYGSKVYQIILPPDSFSVEMSRPNDGVSGLSVVYKDLHGWHVQQKQEEGTAVIRGTGETIDMAYVIASYLFTETPAGDIDFGSGSRETVRIVVDYWNETTGTPTPTPTIINNDYALVIAAGTVPVCATFVVLFLILRRKKSV